jgi:hypothetical protein
LPYRHLDGSTQIPVNPYGVDASNATAIFLNDFMIAEADGYVAPYTGTGGGNLLGVCAGVQGGYSDLSTRYLAASTAGTVDVVDDPDVIFICQEDDAGTALTVAARGANCDVLATAGSTTTGVSAHEIDRSSVTSATAQLRLMSLVNRDDNAYGDSADWEVVINEHAYKATAGI